ncbi:hypothetical protein SAMN05414139_09432 [Burkholderia sp. D7]|nr:hypothetical protein SAMN05414139_09432 [Burkholderia sp. D7]
MVMSKRDARMLRLDRVSFQASRAQLGRIMAPDYKPPEIADLKPGEEIRPYQCQAVDTGMRRKSLPGRSVPRQEGDIVEVKLQHVGKVSNIVRAGAVAAD